MADLITYCLDSPCLKPPYFDPQLFNADLSMIQLSVQTCFVSDLHPLATFRLSIQSEEEPRPSPLVQRCIPPGCCFLLQVAVYEGGVCIGYVLCPDICRFVSISF